MFGNDTIVALYYWTSLDLCTAGFDVLQFNRSKERMMEAMVIHKHIIYYCWSPQQELTWHWSISSRQKHTLVCSTPDTWPHHEPYCLQTSFSTLIDFLGFLLLWRTFRWLMHIWRNLTIQIVKWLIKYEGFSNSSALIRTGCWLQ